MPPTKWANAAHRVGDSPQNQYDSRKLDGRKLDQRSSCLGSSSLGSSSLGSKLRSALSPFEKKSNGFLLLNSRKLDLRSPFDFFSNFQMDSSCQVPSGHVPSGSVGCLNNTFGPSKAPVASCQVALGPVGCCRAHFLWCCFLIWGLRRG